MTVCPGCHNAVAQDQRLAGQAVACPRCGATFLMPRSNGPPPYQPLQPQFSAPEKQQLGEAGESGGGSTGLYAVVALVGGIAVLATVLIASRLQSERINRARTKLRRPPISVVFLNVAGFRKS